MTTLRYPKDDTIAALATPPGEGGVAIIRISGAQALEVAEQMYLGPLRSYKSHTAHFGKIVDEEGTVVDEVLILPMLAPKSYTGENTVEIHCHGGSLVTRSLLDLALRRGARAALPGEFTFRAFMNGKIDLAQAEAVQQLIGAKNKRAVELAGRQLEGSLSDRVKSFQKELFDVAAILEAFVDFPEEGLEFASLEEILANLQSIYMRIMGLTKTFHEGKIVHEGVTLCLIGLPNVGKSSLMNALLGHKRAIVTPIAGTTRDILDAGFRLENLHFNLIDTAGIRESREEVEKEGIMRSKKALKEADFILFVADASRGMSEEDLVLFSECPPCQTIGVWNKVDMTQTFPCPPSFIPISAETGEGINRLKEAIVARVWEGQEVGHEEVVITSARHQAALYRACDSLERLIEGLKTGVSPEFLSSDMRQVLSELGSIIGVNITEEILGAIFSKFCVGK